MEELNDAALLEAEEAQGTYETATQDSYPGGSVSLNFNAEDHFRPSALVVEHDEVVIEMLRQIVESADHEFILVNNLYDVLKAYSEYYISYLLVSGAARIIYDGTLTSRFEDLCEFLLDMKRVEKELPVIFFGHDEEIARWQAVELMNLGAANVVYKPHPDRHVPGNSSIGRAIRALNCKFGIPRFPNNPPSNSETSTTPKKVESCINPIPNRSIVGKAWTVTSGSLFLGTKTLGKRDGKAEFRLNHQSEPTLQKKLMHLLIDRFPNDLSLAEAISELYPGDLVHIQEDNRSIRRTLSKLRTLISDIRKKLSTAGINPEIFPTLSVDVSYSSAIRLQLAHLHKQDDKEEQLIYSQYRDDMCAE